MNLIPKHLGKRETCDYAVKILQWKPEGAWMSETKQGWEKFSVFNKITDLWEKRRTKHTHQYPGNKIQLKNNN